VDASGRGLGDGVRASGEQRYQAEFTGTAGEYFRIWIVNLALTILTLGIYSAWAKVRKRRYFYAHTRIAGRKLRIPRPPNRDPARAPVRARAAGDRDRGGQSRPGAEPRELFGQGAVLRRRGADRPVAARALVQVQRFELGIRNIRLLFLGSYGSCFRVVIRYVWLVFFGILYPYFKHRLVKYSAENHAFGDSAFQADDFKKPFIHAYAVAFGLGLLGAVILLAVFSASAAEGCRRPARAAADPHLRRFPRAVRVRARPHDECSVERNPDRAAALRVQPARA
jgi:hypothetical protein